MSTFRKWRFSILIGSGIIAAGALMYFSSARVSSEKTQGAIGKRDVYRESQVNTADIAAPGQAPVATAAILQSSEFKQLAKNPAFQALLNDKSFAALKSDALFAQLLADTSFEQMVQNVSFMQLINSELMIRALAQSNRQSLNVGLLSQDALYQGLKDNNAFNNLMNNSVFASLLQNVNFRAVMASSALNQLANTQLFNQLLMNSTFRQQLLSQSSSQLLAGLHPHE